MYSASTRYTDTASRTSGSSISSALASSHDVVSSIWRSTQVVRVEPNAISDATTISVQITTVRRLDNTAHTTGSTHSSDISSATNVIVK